MAADSKSADELKDELDALDAEVRKQGAHVRQLKKDGADANEIGEATKALQALKHQASALSQHVDTHVPTFNRKSFDDLIIRKMFIVPSFEIHGGVKGLFDLGPPACALKVKMDFRGNGLNAVRKASYASRLTSSHRSHSNKLRRPL